MITQSKIFEIYQQGKQLYTKSLAPGKKVYDERLIRQGGIEYREWNHEKSKLAAAIMKGCPNVGIRKGDIVLYLGSSTGTTASHVSDMVGEDGLVIGLDVAPRVLRDFIFLCEDRPNMTAMLEDAAQPKTFASKVCEVDIVFQDVAQRNQVDIFVRNCKMFLKKGGYGLLALKARSVDVSAKPKQVFKEARAQLEKEMTVVDFRPLDPFEKDHCFFVVKK